MGARSRGDDYLLSLAGVDIASKTFVEIQELYNKTLESGMHGLCFSPYMDGQGPGSQLSEEQVRRRLEIIQPYTKWVRSFSTTEGNEFIPRIAHELGMKTLVGAWLGDDHAKNEVEINGLIELANEGVADILAVGNEVLYRKDLTEEELIDYIEQVKAACPDKEVGYVDAYYEFENCPNITEACDVILTNCYPFWEGCSLNYSLPYMKDMFHRAKHSGKGKRIIVTETGWPSQGAPFYGAEPSAINAMKYFIDTQVWSKQEDIEIFYFSSFDESWKVGAEGDVGAYWGLWDLDERLKYQS
ncbi:MAG: glycosyl hydrolase family 17 protein [Gammaproteobacteria bacterium]|jgi:glucan 1,3-beta-glucosidase